MSSGVWERRGLLIAPPTHVAFVASHAAVPAVDLGPDETVLVYFTSRDEAGRSHVLRARVDLPSVTAEVETRAILSPGPLGAFDDSGAMSSCVVRTGNEIRLYYVGWHLGVTVPFATFTGLAVSTDGGGTFERASPAPVVERSAIDPYMAHSPWVMREGARWRMWYSSCTEWIPGPDGPRHRYHIRYAESDDGLAWRREGRVAIDYADQSEYALARPCVVRDADRYRMWFTYRAGQGTYRIGYAESHDGADWVRDDSSSGIDVAEEGFDSQMLAYPCVFDVGGDRYMLYNGDGYGRTGIGLAVLKPVSQRR